MVGTDLLSIWGSKVDPERVFILLRSFEERKEQMLSTIQPLQVLAYEAALLAGKDVPQEDEALAKAALTRLSRFRCTAGNDKSTKKRKTSEKECLCGTCVLERVGNWDDDDYYDERCTMLREDLDLSSEINEGLEQRQAKFFEMILGKQLADAVTLRFGSTCVLTPSEPEESAFLYLKDKLEYSAEIDGGGGLFTIDVEDIVAQQVRPTALEKWVFYKAFTLLRRLDDGSVSSGDTPKNLFQMVVQPYPYW